MRIDAVSIGSGAGLAAWANAISAGRLSNAQVDGLVALGNSPTFVTDLLGVIAASELPQTTQVELSQAALALFSADPSSGEGSNLGKLAQELLVALILALLDPGRAAS